MDKKEIKEMVKTYNLVISFFIEIFVGMALGYFFGRFLDNLFFEEKKILTFVFLFLGLMSALVSFIKKVLKTFGEGEKNEKE